MPSTLQFQVNPPVDNAKTFIAYDEPPTLNPDGSVDGDFDEGGTNPNGYKAYLHVEPRHIHVLIRAKGFEDIRFDCPMPHDDLITVELVPSPISLLRLIGIDSQAHRMFNAEGELVYGRGASAFLLFRKWLEGADIAPFLAQHRSEFNCNVLRVMGMFESLGGFNPNAYGDRYYDEIRPFMQACERQGFYVYWCCCAATGVWMNENEAIAHIQRTVDCLLPTNNAIFSPVNEQGQHVNSINQSRSSAIDKGWLLHDEGSFGEDLPSDPPFGTHVCLHTTRKYPGEVKDGNIVDHPNHVAQNLEVWIDEPYRMGDDGKGDRFADPKTAREAAGSAYTALGWVVHSMQGERGDVLTGNTLDCARAAFDAMSGH